MTDVSVPRVSHLTGEQLLRWLTEGARALAQYRERINQLNHFPVPDADTGTNMLVTWEAALEVAEAQLAAADLASVAESAAAGAFQAARGNSGIILAQVLASLAAACQDRASLHPVGFSQALQALADAAWEAVANPVEGTMLTTLRAVAKTLDYYHEFADVTEVSLVASMAGRQQIQEYDSGPTGTADAGAVGMSLLLAVLADVLGAGTREVALWQEETAALLELGVSQSPDLADEFEVMYVLHGPASLAHQVRQLLTTFGNSVAVTGSEDLLRGGQWQVHVHTTQPQRALALPGQLAPAGLGPALRFGHVRHLGGGAGMLGLEEPAATTAPGVSLLQRSGRADQALVAPGIVAITAAPGLVEQLARTGAVVVYAAAEEPAAAHAAIGKAIREVGQDVVGVSACSPQLRQAAAIASQRLRDGQRWAAGTHVVVTDAEDEAGVLATTLALAGALPRTWPTEQRAAEVARRGARALHDTRIVALQDPSETEFDDAVRSLLVDQPEVLTVIVGAHLDPALPDRLPFLLSPLSGWVDGETDLFIVQGGQSRPDVLLSAE